MTVKSNNKHIATTCLTVQGRVQGVGFRPFVYQLAQILQLSGFVQNTGDGVTIYVQGEQRDLFVEKLQQDLPYLATIDSLHCQQIFAEKQTDFRIVASSHEFGVAIPIPDSATCDACLQDLFDAQHRLYHYPFISCIQCGPRYSVLQQLPYDRDHTSLQAFTRCADCDKDYHRPHQRRHHCQSLACSACGPVLSLALSDVATAILAGQIIALKSLGGYQLICDATNSAALLRIRQWKKRAAKPFAVMFANLASVKQAMSLAPTQQQLLSMPAAPIVVLENVANDLPYEVTAGLTSLGIFLAHTPVQHLLFAILSGDVQYQVKTSIVATSLVVTSGNQSGGAIITDDEQAQQELSTIADLIVSHNYPIVTQLDDSVINIIDAKPRLVRMARGFACQPFALPGNRSAVLALGGLLKNTICIARQEQAIVSQHIGSLTTQQSINAFHNTIAHVKKVFRFTPEWIACDKHPDFYSSQYVQQRDIAYVLVQHHHAHLAATACEYQLRQPYLGLCLDGYGYGDDGSAWGGEFFYVNGIEFKHVAQIGQFKIAGADKASREPWRVATALLSQAGYAEKAMQLFTAFQPQAVLECLAKNINCHISSSTGRLFDAFAALAGICFVQHYEAQAAMLLEQAVTQPQIVAACVDISAQHISLLPLVAYLIDQDATTIANVFHGTLAYAFSVMLQNLSEKFDTRDIVLSGGCLQNKVLTHCLFDLLPKRQFNLYLAQKIPSNDAGISLGQAYLVSQGYRSATCV